MEPVIAVLPPHVVDQIAAGEVIERPASVVKELVDNAIDAGASAIAVEVTAGGRGVIRVTDDGCGMSARSAMLALERHATSKLRAVEDLWELATAGFRGEALPSIASVSRMTLTTRRAGADAATRITIDAGRVVSAGDAGAPVGTTVEVADLLYNMPARLKFLKGEATEASHITELVGKLAMAYPRLHVRLRHNGRTALDVPPDRDGFARAQALLGARVAARMMPVSGEESGVRVTAYLGAPELAQATARGVQLFVGRRPVRDRGLLHALAMGYGELVPRGRYPLAIVLLDLPAGTVDVNVHPQKLEVRFSDPAVVAAAVRHVVQAGVAAARWREQAAGGAPVQLVGLIGMTGATATTAASGLAPPALPFDAPADAAAPAGGDGRVATRLAERQLAEIASRQMPLGFGRPDLAAPSVRRAVAPAPGSASRREIDPRAWARSLREQTQAARAEEPRAPYRAESGAATEPPAAPAAPWFPPAAEPPVERARSGEVATRAFDAALTDADLEPPSQTGAQRPAAALAGEATSRAAAAMEAAGGLHAAGGWVAPGQVAGAAAMATTASPDRAAHGDGAAGMRAGDVVATGDGATGMRATEVGAAEVGAAGVGIAGMRAGDVGAADVGAARMRAGDVGAADVGAADVGAARMRAGDVGAADVGPARMRASDVGAADVGAAHGDVAAKMRAGDVGAADVGAARMRAGDVGAADVGAADVGAARMRASDVGAADVGGADVGIAGMRAGDAGAADVGAADVGAADVGAAWMRATDVDAADEVDAVGMRAAYVGAGDVGAAPEADIALWSPTLARSSSSTSLAAAAATARPGFFAQLRYLGQLDLTYLVCEGEGELVLIDQHAAHERVELARLRERLLRGDARGPVQRLLFPATLDATPAQLALVRQIGALLAQVGFEVEPSGEATLAVKSVPAGLRHGDPVQLLRRLLHDGTAAGAPDDLPDDLDDRLDALLGAIACHAAVRAGDRLTPSEAEALVRSLDGVDPHAPGLHGRSALLRLSLTEIARRFGP